MTEVQKSELKRKLKAINYEVDYGNRFVIRLKERTPNYYVGLFFLVIGVIRLLIGNILISVVPMIFGIWWIVRHNMVKSKFEKLDRRKDTIEITGQGLKIVGKSGEIINSYSTDNLSDLILEESSKEDLSFVVLKVNNLESTEIELLKSFNTKPSKSVMQDVANIIINIWDEKTEV